MKPIDDLSREQVADALEYDPLTGDFRWKKKSHKATPGQIAGGLSSRGYRLIRVGTGRYKAHRLAWLLTYGEWPQGMVDHINGNPSDNRIANLREASDAQNCLNRKIRSDNKSGEKGVSADPKGWRARINVNGKTVHLGYFESIDLAADAARRARERFHGEFCRHS